MPAQTRKSLRQRAVGGGPQGPGDRHAAARLDVLGGFTLHRDGASTRQPPHVQRLVAFLALHRRPLHLVLRVRSSVARSHAGARLRCLRTTLWRIGDCEGLLEATRTHLALGDWVEVDATELETCADAILRRGGIADEAGMHLLVHSSHLLPDWYDDWVVDERERLADSACSPSRQRQTS